VGVGAGQVGFGPAAAAPATAPSRNPAEGERGVLKVLWVSQHKLLREEERQLRLYAQRLGLRLELDKYGGKVPSTEWLVKNKILADGYKIVIVVLPLSMVAHLVEFGRRAGFEVWRPKMERLHFDRRLPCPEFDPATDVMVPTLDEDGDPVFLHNRFVRFEKVIDLKLVTEAIEVG